MRRRELIAVLGVLAVAPALSAGAQQTERTYRVGHAHTGSEAGAKPFEQAFLSLLRDRGYVVGRNLVYDSRYAGGEPTRLPELVDELIALKPDVLAGSDQVARVMLSKTSTVPIVITFSGDAVAAGLVQSLSRPGGNVTGVSLQYVELVVKHLDLIREVLPHVARVAQFHDVNVPQAGLAEEHVREAAKRLGLEYVPYNVTNASEVEKAFAAMERNPPDALLPATGSGLMYSFRQRLADESLRLRVASTGLLSVYADVGGLLSYGPSLEDAFRLAASYVDRILKGAKPGDLPVEQPTKFELVINLRTAMALGLTIPQTVLVRADRVID